MNFDWWPAVVALITGGVGMEITRSIFGWVSGREPEKRKKNKEKIRDYENEHESRLQEREFSLQLIQLLVERGVPRELWPEIPEYRQKDGE